MYQFDSERSFLKVDLVAIEMIAKYDTVRGDVWIRG